jgi:excisionase family DNA binding protein
VGTDFVQRVDTDSLDMTSTENFGTEPNKALWTTADVARFLGCSERQVYKLRKEGMPTLRVGGMVRFDQSKILTWLETRDSSDSSDERARQLADIAASGDDASECAEADLEREFPSSPA